MSISTYRYRYMHRILQDRWGIYILRRYFLTMSISTYRYRYIYLMYNLFLRFFQFYLHTHLHVSVSIDVHLWLLNGVGLGHLPSKPWKNLPRFLSFLFPCKKVGGAGKIPEPQNLEPTIRVHLRFSVNIQKKGGNLTLNETVLRNGPRYSIP